MAGRLEGKVALVTGAGSVGEGWGNGKATAVLFAREGASVFAIDINPESAETLGWNLTPTKKLLDWPRKASRNYS